MKIMKQRAIFILLNYFLLNTLNAQYVDSIPIVNTYYQHILINYNEQLIKATAIVSDFKHNSFLSIGFKNYEVNPQMELWTRIPSSNKFIRQKENYIFIPEIDTVNTVRWFNSINEDSSIYLTKIWYAYVLHKFGEKRLNTDSNRKLRLLYPGDFLNADKNLILIKATFQDDSLIVEKKVITDMSIQIVETYSLIAKKKNTIVRKTNCSNYSTAGI